MGFYSTISTGYGHRIKLKTGREIDDESDKKMNFWLPLAASSDWMRNAMGKLTFSFSSFMYLLFFSISARDED